MRLMLQRLLAQQALSPGTALPVCELIAAGWPGERMKHRSGVRRVYTEIGRMRDLGLRDVLLHDDDGYFLAPHVAVVDGRFGQPKSA